MDEIWQDLTEIEDTTLGKKLVSIYRQTVSLPYPEIQYKLLSAYLTIPSRLARVVPLLTVSGVSGSGKSLIGLIASKLHGVPICTGADTFASLRNTLNQIRDNHNGNCLLVWDDIDPDIFTVKPDIYRMLKSGYDRSSAIISIASKNAGENVPFNTFSLKLLSTIHPIYNLPQSEFVEIARRCIAVKTQKTDTDLVDPRLIDWSGLSGEFHSLWANDATCEYYQNARKTIAKKRPKCISSERWIITVDLLASGIIQGLFEINGAVDFAISYWEYFDKHINGNSGATIDLLRDYITTEQVAFNTINAQAGITDEPFIIDATKLKKQLTNWHTNGQLDIADIKQKTVAYLMGKLGYTLTKQGWVQQ